MSKVIGTGIQSTAPVTAAETAQAGAPKTGRKALGWYGNKPVVLVHTQRYLKAATNNRFTVTGSNYATAAFGRAVRLVTKTAGQTGQAVYQAVDSRVGDTLRETKVGRQADRVFKAITHDLGTKGVQAFEKFKTSRQVAARRNLLGDLAALADNKHLTGVGTTKFADRLVFSRVTPTNNPVSRLDDQSLTKIDALLKRDFDRVDAMAAKGGKRLAGLFMSKNYAKQMVQTGIRATHREKSQQFADIARANLRAIHDQVRAEIQARGLRTGS